jgi:IclR family transcriptional regulator, acetate operon repressor
MPVGAQRGHLEQSLESARRNGYAISRGEIFVGAVAVSSPYFDHRGSVVGSVGLYGPNARISDDKLLEYAKLVREAGRKISTLLGFQQPGKSADLSDHPGESIQKQARKPPRSRA